MQLQAFKDYSQRFVDYLITDLNRSTHTCRAYASDLAQFAEFWQKPGHQELSLKKAIYHYLHQHIQSKTIDKKSLARKISCFNTFEKFLALHNIVVELELQRPQLPDESPECLSIKEITYLLDEIPHERLPTHNPYRDKTILELLYATGIRPSELVGLLVRHLNLKEQTLVVLQKRKGQRVVLFGKKAAEQLEHYLKCERKAITTTSEHLFLNHRSQPLTTRSIQRICNMFSAFLSRDCVITPSVLRHSCAVHLLQGGSDLELVRELLGTTRVSAEKYLSLAHAFPKDLINDASK